MVVLIVKKIIISTLFYLFLFLPYLNYASADHTLLHKLKSKSKSKNDIKGSTSANDSAKTPTLKKCKKKNCNFSCC